MIDLLNAYLDLLGENLFGDDANIADFENFCDGFEGDEEE